MGRINWVKSQIEGRVKTKEGRSENKTRGEENQSKQVGR